MWLLTGITSDNSSIKLPQRKSNTSYLEPSEIPSTRGTVAEKYLMRFFLFHWTLLLMTEPLWKFWQIWKLTKIYNWQCKLGQTFWKYMQTSFNTSKRWSEMKLTTILLHIWQTMQCVKIAIMDLISNNHWYLLHVQVLWNKKWVLFFPVTITCHANNCTNWNQIQNHGKQKWDLIKYLGTPHLLAAIFYQGKQFLLFPVCFPVGQISSKMGTSTKNLLPLGGNSFMRSLLWNTN